MQRPQQVPAHVKVFSPVNSKFLDMEGKKKDSDILYLLDQRLLRQIVDFRI